ncbi:MAG: hypothetical protein CMH56_00150 [Myxococcales bacterium]|nr:hypothetical protein [Myxococcales bacterium]|tara:strand:+ start:2222 stop:2782 length:561 start_codon:yes stop_codon:yes gene_type:complete
MSEDKPGPVHEEAAFILDKARGLVRDMLAEADHEVAAQIEAASQKGQNEGRAALDDKQALVQDLENRIHAELSEQGVSAALSLSKALLLTEQTENKEFVVELVANALASVKDADRVWLRVNPLDAPTLKTHKGRLINVLGRASDIDIRVDRSVKQGGVLIQTGAGAVDAQLDTQLEEIGRILGVDP